jgi:hypothetical protein
MPAPPSDWSDFVGSLISSRVRFLIVGAHALAAIGRPRFTADLDIWIEPTDRNAERFGAALADFGYPQNAKQWRKLALPDRMITIGREPLRIDVMTSISGVAFGAAWRSRLKGKFGGHAVGFLGPATFVANKRAAGRPKDLLDIALLEEVAPLVPQKRKAVSIATGSPRAGRKKR